MSVLDRQIADFPSQVAHTVEHLQALKPRHYGVLTQLWVSQSKREGLLQQLGRFAASQKTLLRQRL